MHFHSLKETKSKQSSREQNQVFQKVFFKSKIKNVFSKVLSTRLKLYDLKIGKKHFAS